MKGIFLAPNQYVRMGTGVSFLGIIATTEHIYGQLWKVCPVHLEWYVETRLFAPVLI
jgi:hypothetical protein